VADEGRREVAAADSNTVDDSFDDDRACSDGARALRDDGPIETLDRVEWLRETEPDEGRVLAADDAIDWPKTEFCLVGGPPEGVRLINGRLVWLLPLLIWLVLLFILLVLPVLLSRWCRLPLFRL
jgi:hypothetical protein